jgi:competence protein ComEA
MLSVHISGAVAEPGVYDLPPGSIVQEAVTEAGGLLDEANLDLVNLAARLEDGQQVHVPRIQPTELSSGEQFEAIPAPYNERVNINTATAPELEQLPGIGPALAQSLIEYRQANGPFQSIDDLINVPGIGPAKLDGLRDLIRLQ